VDDNVAAGVDSLSLSPMAVGDGVDGHSPDLPSDPGCWELDEQHIDGMILEAVDMLSDKGDTNTCTCSKNKTKTKTKTKKGKEKEEELKERESTYEHVASPPHNHTTT